MTKNFFEDINKIIYIYIYIENYEKIKYEWN